MKSSQLTPKGSGVFTQRLALSLQVSDVHALKSSQLRGVRIQTPRQISTVQNKWSSQSLSFRQNCAAAANGVSAHTATTTPRKIK